MAPIKGSRTVLLEGRGQLTLRDADYIATGGEGSIYRAHATVVKLYSDQTRMMREDMTGKVKLLSGLTHPSIISPKGLVTDEKNQPIGFYMPWVEAESLPQFFVNDFRQKISFGERETKLLVERMRETVQYAHDYRATIVDGNELNWLVKYPNAQGPEPVLIDVDSWSIGKWPATVIMPSIHDWHSTTFGESSDWFAWGVVTFQLFTGIHPYKGRLDGYKPGELERRMKDNASVFTSNIRLPHSVRDFATIPNALRDWYEATFQDGERTAPPSVFVVTQATKAARVLRTVVTANNNLIFERLFNRAGTQIIRTFPAGVALLFSGELIDMTTGLTLGCIVSPKVEVVRVPNGFLVADIKNGKSLFWYVDGHTATELNISLNVQRFFRAENRLFAVTDRELAELHLRILGRPILTIGSRWSIRPQAIRWFDSIAVVDMLGSTFLYLPLPDGSMQQVHAIELDSLTPLAATAGPRFATVLAVDRLGEYHKFEFTFEKDYKTYSLWRGKSDTPELNAAILPNGVVATIVDDGTLTIFVPVNGNLQRIKDRGITTALNLSTWNEKVIYIKDDTVWRVRVK